MGFRQIEEKARELTKRPVGLKGLSLKLLHEAQCSACPLNREPNRFHPHMEPTGSDKPVVYMLGEAPGKEEDRLGRQFIGKSGEVLRMRILPGWEDDLRWNNVIRTRPPDNRDPLPIEIECCRPSIVKDIERSKPVAIFGFGNVPLKWIAPQTDKALKITQWSGKRFPVKVGRHVCWYYPMLHPSGIIRTRKFSPDGPDEFGSENEFAFAFHIRRALEEIDRGLPTPVVHDKERALARIEYVTGHGGSKDYHTIRGWLDRLSKEKVVGWDWETTGLSPYVKDARILSVSFSGRDFTCAFPIGHSEAGWSEGERRAVFKLVEDFLWDTDCLKIAHHLPFELEWAAEFIHPDLLWAGSFGDSRCQAYLLDERRGVHSLDALCIEHFGFSVKGIETVNVKKLDREPLPSVLVYNGLDAKYCRKLFLLQRRLLEREGLDERYEHHVERSIALLLTQRKGVPVDQKVVRRLDNKYRQRITFIERKIQSLPEMRKFKEIVGHDFRPSSNPDLSKMLKRVLRVQTEGGDKKALEQVKHPLAKWMLKYRSATKIHSTYILPILGDSPHIDDNGFMHPTLKACDTDTARTASEDPNSQNYPKRTKGKEVRKAVKHPDPDYVCVAYDYAGIQARNVAMESRDANLVKAYWDEYDIHSDWTERIARKYPRWIKEGVKELARDKVLFKQYRNRAKNELVFPLFFGAYPKKLSGELGIPINYCYQLSDDFWHEFPDVHGWHRAKERQLLEYGYVDGLSGYRRRAPISSNQLINAPIQADEALIVCEAMVALSKIQDEFLQPNMEIHDDLTFFWPRKKVDELAPKVISEMIRIRHDWVNVPLVVEMSVGRDWFGLEEVGVFSSDGWDENAGRMIA